MSQQSEIKSLIRSIAGGSSASTSATLFEAEVASVEKDTCAVRYQGITHTGVRLACGFIGGGQTAVTTPKVGSTVLVADLSVGKFRDMLVLLASQIDTIVINGGENGGLINIRQLTDHLNTIEQDLNNLKQIFNTWQAAGSVGDAAALKSAITSAAWDTNTITLSSTSDYEDPNITH